MKPETGGRQRRRQNKKRGGAGETYIISEMAKLTVKEKEEKEE